MAHSRRSGLKILRIVGVLILIAGGVSIGISQNIKKKVAEGRIEISSGEQKVSTGKKIFGVTPVTGAVGNKVFLSSGEERIAAGKEEADRYEAMADSLQIGGIVGIIIGAGCILWSFKKR